MSITEKLDLAIKLYERKTTVGGYTVSYKNEEHLLATYMTNDEWKSFEAHMKQNACQPNAHTEYEAGGGDELSEKNGRPPKMASYGSSSRMIYMLSREKEGFHYEKKLPTTIGGTANLDGFCEDNDRYIFVEAKCHEPYSKKNNSVSICYEKLYERINKDMDGKVRIEMTTSKCRRYLNVNYFVGEMKLERLDMKQMICHLLGIATGLLDGTLKKKKTDFIYLLYDPTKLEIAPDAKGEIVKIYERTCYEANQVDFAKLFRVILKFLIETKFKDAASNEESINKTVSFTFKLVSQNSYPNLIH